MSDERLKFCAITPIKQSFEMGCGPTSVAMVLSGFGVNTTEQILAERYFPTALLPSIDPASGKINYNSGVDDQHLVDGMVQTLEGLGLASQLRVDVFDSCLWEYTSSSQERYIVEATSKTMKEYGEKFKKDDLGGNRVRTFYQTLEKLVKDQKIRVYTANARLMPIGQDGFMSYVTKDMERGFYGELADFVKKGHIVGPHGGGTGHIRVLDGSKTEKITWVANEEGFLMLDPEGESYPTRLSSLVMINVVGIRGDIFDYLFRVSPQDVLNPQQYGIPSFLHNLRRLLP